MLLILCSSPSESLSSQEVITILILAAASGAMVQYEDVEDVPCTPGRQHIDLHILLAWNHSSLREYFRLGNLLQVYWVG